MSDVADLNLFFEYQSRTFCADDGTTAPALSLVVGDQMKIAVFPGESNSAGYGTKTLFVRSIAASIGALDVPPIDGVFKVAIGGVTSAAIAFGSTAAQVLTALAACTIVTNVLQALTSAAVAVPSDWLVETNVVSTDDAPAFTLISNGLRPESFVKIVPFKAEGFWWCEIFLIQTPWAFANSFETVLNEPPSIVRIRAGSASTDDDTTDSNEIQQLKVPLAFQGTYYITFGFRTTTMIGNGATTAVILAALEGMYTDGLGPHFAVTNPADQFANIEFIGILADAPQSLMTVTPVSFSPGAIVFTLDLSLEPMRVAMRGQAALANVPFELLLELNETQADLDAGDIPGRYVRFQTVLALTNEQITAELATAQSIPWLVPPSPKDYIAFTLDQIITGIQTYVSAFGDAVHSAFAFVHNLGTSNIHVTVRENTAAGRLLTPNADYIATYASDNEIDVAFSIIPTEIQYVVILSTAGPISVFQSHTHTIGQIVGLQDELNSLGAELAAIIDMLPFTNPTLPSTVPGKTLTLPIPDFYSMIPARLPAGFDVKAGIPPRFPGFLYPAVNTTSTTSLVAALPDPTTVTPGTVYVNNYLAGLLIPGDGGNPPAVAAIGDFIACDGRGFYLVEKQGSSSSYFPIGMDQILFTVYVNPSMFPTGKVLSATFTLALQTFLATTAIQYVLEIFVGTINADVSPGTPATNLESFTFNDTPMLTQQLVIGNVPQGGDFGVAIASNLDSSFSGNIELYDNWVGAASGSLPTSGLFVLQGRLSLFDTQDDKPNAKGIIFVSMTSATITISSNS